MRTKRVKILEGRFCAIAVFLGCVLLGPVFAQDWPGFHGFERQGVSFGSSIEWSNAMDVSWKTQVPGFGFSSPVVHGDKIYLTTAYETATRSNTRKTLTYSSVLLAWGLFVIVSGLALRTAGNQAGEGVRFLTGARAFSLMFMSLLVLGVVTFGEGLFILNYSFLRSWKLATLMALAGFTIALLLLMSRVRATVAYILVSGCLSLMAYSLMPRKELFWNFAISGGITATAVVLAPVIFGLAVGLGDFYLRRRFKGIHVEAPFTTWRASAGKILLYCGLPLVLTAGILWALMVRIVTLRRNWEWDAPDEPVVSVQFEPVLGWAFFTVAAVLAVVAIVAESRYAIRNRSFSQSVAMCGVPVAILLAVSCLLQFAVFPAKRQMAYAVSCVKKDTGTLQWVREVGYSEGLRDFKGENSHATPTLAAGPAGLCAYFGSGGLYGLDFEGKVTWKVEDAQFDSPFGVGHSPVMAGNLVLLANDNESQPEKQKLESHIVAFNARDGSVVWRQKRQRSQPGLAGFSTPIVRSIAGRKTVLMRGWEDLTAYDLETGRILWSHKLKHHGNFLVAGLITDEKRVFVVDGAGVRSFTLEGLAAGKTDMEWLARIPGEKVSTPVLVDGLIFLATDTGVAACVNAEDGTVEWRHKFGGRFFSSVVSHGNSVVFANETGDLAVVARDRSFKLLAEKKLGEKIYASSLPQADGLLVRATTNMLFLRPATIISAVNKKESSPVAEQLPD
jgi:outer membrane protein assembly factor BamB